MRLASPARDFLVLECVVKLQLLLPLYTTLHHRHGLAFIVIYSRVCPSCLVFHSEFNDAGESLSTRTLYDRLDCYNEVIKQLKCQDGVKEVSALAMHRAYSQVSLVRRRRIYELLILNYMARGHCCCLFYIRRNNIQDRFESYPCTVQYTK